MDKAAEPEFQLTNDVGGQAVDVLTDKLVGHMLIALISEPKNTFYAKNATIHSYNSCIFLCVLQLTAAEEAQLWGTCTCSDLVCKQVLVVFPTPFSCGYYCYCLLSSEKCVSCIL